MKSKPGIRFLLLATIAFSSILEAATDWDAEIRVDGELIPVELIQGYQKHHNRIETDCPPLSDIRDRDRLVSQWVLVKAAEQRGLQINDEGMVGLAKLEEKLKSEQAQSNPDYMNKYLWLTLSHKASRYWRDHVRDVDTQDVEAEYERLVQENDSRFVDALFFQVMNMESKDKDYLEQLAERLRAGESWRQVSVDIDPDDWNSFHTVRWYSFDGLDKYSSKAFHALNLDGKELIRNDVIGPLSEMNIYRLMVILDKTTIPQVPLYAKFKNTENWAANQIKSDMYLNRRKALAETLLEGVEVTQDGQPVTILQEHGRCPG